MVMGLLAATATASPYPHLAIPKRQEDTPKPTPKGQTFADIKPSPELSWVDCYTEKWQCAYLTVPLDYADPSVGTTDIAFIRYLLSEDAEDLLFNPGEPTPLSTANLAPTYIYRGTWWFRRRSNHRFRLLGRYWRKMVKAVGSEYGLL
jgi:hypothetical protein